MVAESMVIQEQQSGLWEVALAESELPYFIAE